MQIPKEIHDKVGGKIYASRSIGRQPVERKSTIQEYQQGLTVQHYNKDFHSWIQNGDCDNVFVLLRELYKKSAKHKGAIDLKANMIYGGGLAFRNQEKYFEFDKFGIPSIVRNAMSDAEKEDELDRAELFSRFVCLDDFAKDAIHQFSIYGGYFKNYSMFLNAQGELNLRNISVESTPNCRLGSRKSHTPDGYKSDRIYMSDDWDFASPNKVIPYDQFHAANAGYMRGNVTCLDAYRKDIETPGLYMGYTGRVTEYRPHYGTPDYESIDVLTYAEIDYLMSQGDMKDVKSGFALEYIIVRYRTRLSDAREEEEEKEKDIQHIRQTQGVTGSNGLMMWVEPKTDESGNLYNPEPIKVITIPNDNNSNRHKTVRDSVKEVLMNGHNIISPEIIGLKSERSSGMSNQAELLATSITNLHWRITKPAQEIILKDILHAMEINGLKCEPYFKDTVVNFKQISDKLLELAYGKDEMRAKYGDGKMSEEVAQEVMNRVQSKKNNNELQGV